MRISDWSSDVCSSDLLRRLGFGDLDRVDPGDTATGRMYLQHDLHRLFTRVAEKVLQDLDHEFHRRVIVIDDDDLAHRRARESGLGFFQRQALSRIATFDVVAHPPRSTIVSSPSRERVCQSFKISLVPY